MKNRFLYILICIGLSLGTALAQKTAKETRQAVKAYRKGEIKASANLFDQVLSKDSLNSHANYGRGNTAYKQGKWDDALQHYQRIANQPNLSHQQKADLLHNTGNVYMKKKDYSQAVEMYKQSLLQNPEDEQTRYNLVLAQKLLQQQKDQNKNNGGGGNSDQQNKNQPNQSPKDQNKDQQDQNKNKDQDKNKQDQNKNNKQDNKSDQSGNQQNEPQQGQLSKEQADQLLKAFKQDDDKVRRKYEEQKRALEQKQDNKNKKKW